MSQGPTYLSSVLSRWLILALDIVVAVLSISVIALALFLDNFVSGPAVGMALNVAIATHGTLLSLVNSWASFEVSLGAIERLETLDRTLTKEDLPGEDQTPPNTWPHQGQITINQVSAKYR